jgi:hypothetical protein
LGLEQINVGYTPYFLNFDVDLTKLQTNEGRYLKNTRFKLGSASNVTGGTDGVITPLPSNEVYCSGLDLPDGQNKTIGAYEFQELNEIYWIVWNSENNHSIYIIDGTTEICQLVYRGSCLNLSLETEDAIPEHRVTMKVQYSEANGVQTIVEKFLIFTDGNSNVRQINVLASIGSESFTTNYFEAVFPYRNCCDYITLAPIAPLYRPKWSLIERVEDNNGDATDKDIPNKLFNRSLQVSYQFIYIDGRESSISSYSKPIIVGGTDCFEQNPDVLPRCAEFNFWVGNAFVDKINIYVRECSDCPTGDCQTNWTLYDTLDKHKCDTNVKWWERENAWEDYDYNSDANEITYIFCNNKECTPVDQNIFTHIENEIPFKSKSVVALGDKIALSNNLRGSNNLSCEQVESFTISVEAQPDEECIIQKRNITMYAIIRNDSIVNGFGNECEFLFGDVVDGKEIPIEGKFYFGGMGWRKHPVTGTKRVAIDDFWKDYKQYVPSSIEGEDTIGGFVGYLAGTNFVTISEQVKLVPDTCDVQALGIVYRDVANIAKNNGSFDDVIKELKDGEYLILQKFTFKDVPSGKYVFRMAGHRTGYTLNYERTSTYTYRYESLPCSTGGDFSPAIYDTYEAIVDVCDNDYDSLQEGRAVVIKDLTYPTFLEDTIEVVNKWFYNLVSELYLYEDEDLSIPFEKQTASFNVGSYKNRALGTIHDLDSNHLVSNPFLIPPLVKASEVTNTPSKITDHNGFVFMREEFWRRRSTTSVVSVPIPIPFTVFYTEPTLGTITITYTNGCTTDTLANIMVGKSQVSPNVTIGSNKGYRGLKGTSYKFTDTALEPCNRIQIKGRILSDEGKKLAGINVGFSGSQFIRTDGFGRFSIDVHQTPSFDRDGYFMISNAGNSCMIVCNDNCDACCESMFDEYDFTGICGVGSDESDCPQVIIDKGDLEFKKVNSPDKGLKGRYGIGVIGWDCYGRLVTGGVNEITYIDTNECWNKHPLIKWEHDGLTLLPSEVKAISFVRTKNLNGTILQWSADNFILIDKFGNETSSRSQASSMAIDLQSLLEYNRQNNLNVLTTYSFVKGDMVKIIDDCDNPITYLITGDTFGTLQNTALEQELTLTSNGTTSVAKTNYAISNGGRIIIPYDSRLDDYLNKCAVKIEIVRPYECTTSFEPYFEVSDMIDVTDGVLAQEEGVLDTWDTYKIFRNIPKDIDCDQNTSDDSYFSNNITDFWGKGCTDAGRPFTKNPFAQRRWMENEMAISKSWVNNGKYNGLSTFWGEDVKQFKDQNFGGIVAVNVQRNYILFICENDYFTTTFDQNYLQVDASGNVKGVQANTISEPNPKVGMNYGCSYEHISSIIFYDGTAYWYDAKNAGYIVCDYQKAIDVSIPSFVKSYISEKTMYVNNYNNSVGNDPMKVFEVVSGVCPLHKEVHLTFRKRNDLSNDDSNFVNDQRTNVLSENETFVFDTINSRFTNARAYTPEYYAKLRTSSSGIQLIVFREGLAYKQNTNAQTSNVFFGVPTKSVIEISSNLFPSKVKIFQSISEEIKQFPLMVDRIYTNEPNSYSYIPNPYFKKKENIHYAEILRDMSSYFDPNKQQVSMLVDGKRIFGQYAVIRLIPNGTNESSYFELNKIWVLFSGSELSMKPQVAE